MQGRRGREGQCQAVAKKGTVHGQPSGPGDLVRRHEPCVPKGPERYPAIGSDHQVSDAAVVEGEPEPAFGRELQRPAHDIADDVGVTDEDLIAVLFLPGVCSVDVVPERSLDPGSVLIILLRAERGIVSVDTYRRCWYQDKPRRTQVGHGSSWPAGMPKRQ